MSYNETMLVVQKQKNILRIIEMTLFSTSKEVKSIEQKNISCDHLCTFIPVLDGNP